MEKYLEHVKGKILCREVVIRQLFSLIGSSDDPMFNSIFIYGHIATGKSLVTDSLLAYLKYNISSINCIEHVNSKHIYNYILADLSQTTVDLDTTIKPQQRCDNMIDFILRLKEIANVDNRPIVIVFDRCDRLRDIESSVLSAFLRLSEFTGLDICTIFISDIIWEKFRTKIGMYEPIKVHFPQYTKDEFIEILMLYKPKSCEASFYRQYLNLFLSVFLRFCRDLNELRYMAKGNFSKYIEPVMSKRIKKDDIPGLWRNISPIFKASLEVIYLRVSADDFAKRDQLCKEIESTAKLALSFELPYYAKYMLIAAYLSSYNPAKEDKRIFMKQKSQKKRRVGTTKKTAAIRSHSGLHSFPISRMLAIFCAILNEKVDINANLLAQIPTMCQLSLLTPIGTGNLDEPKYKCMVSRDFISVIAKTVGFNLQNYLYDFMN